LSNHVADSTSATAPAGAEATTREIAQQPETWAEVAAIVAASRSELDDFLEPILARDDLRIVLTGAGTSAFVGEIAAPALSRLLGRRVDAVSTTDLVSNPREYFAENLPTLLVSFARSGNSPESVAATRLADECLASIDHLIVTCDARGALLAEHQDRAHSRIVLMPERANDRGFAMTSSFTSMLLSSLLVFGAVSTVDDLAAAAREILGGRADDIRTLAARGYRRVVYLGSGSLRGLARESALKLLELTAGEIVTYYDSSLGFRHGPKAVLDDQTLVVVYVSSDPYTRLYDLDIIAELRAAIGEANVVAVATEDLPGTPAWVLSSIAGVVDAALAVPFIVIAQLIGLAFALELGKTPDNPFPGGDVNRVVEGVSIHALPPAGAHAQ
jgi:tagatose-6-phosphate ketose/aldose isomerase